MPDRDTATAVATPPERTPSPISGPTVRPGDRVFRGTAVAAGSLVLLLVMGGHRRFPYLQGYSALDKDTTNFFTTQVWQPDAVKPTFGIAAAA